MARCAATSVALAAVASAVALGGCGSGGGAGAPIPPPPASSAKVALLLAPERPGEVIVRGDASPATHGPFAFHGRYLVRFEQFAPEDPRMDFRGQTAFVARLDRRAQSSDRATVRLFRAAARNGRTTARLDGRYFVDVTFGDFPYAVRFTPLRDDRRRFGM